MRKFIYADNAATTRMSEKAFDAMTQYLLSDYANASQPYSFARESKKALIKSREIIAQCIGANPEEIFFTSGGTESDNWVIKSSAPRNIITSQIEHHAILNSCKYSESQDRNVKYLPVNNKGILLPSTLDGFINGNELVSVMLSNNEIGTIEPISELSKIAHRHGAIFHTDAVQAIGHIEVDVNQLGVDLLSASGHKFNGPKGIGFLYIRKGIELPSFISGGSQELNHRAGTENIPSIVAMVTALKENVDSLSSNKQYIRDLELMLLNMLSESHIDFQRNGDSNHIPGNISLSFRGLDGEAILHRLDLMGICVSTGSACDSKETQISHVLKAIKINKSYAKGTIRISLGKDNIEQDIKTIVSALIKISKA